MDKPQEKKKDELSEDDLKHVNGGALQIEGIKGESQDDKHKDGIEISS